MWALPVSAPASAVADLTPDAPAAGELRLRAAQLAAGIDAWTGGWYGHQLSTPTP